MWKYGKTFKFGCYKLYGPDIVNIKLKDAENSEFKMKLDVVMYKKRDKDKIKATFETLTIIPKFKSIKFIVPVGVSVQYKKIEILQFFHFLRIL